MRNVLAIVVTILFATVVWAQSGLEEIDGQGADPYRHYRLDNAAGTCLSTGYSIVALASATPSAIPVYAPDGVVEPFLLTPTANTCLVGSSGIYGSPAISNLVQRASAESWDDANTPTGWTETETAGAGAAASSEENSRVAHGGSSMKAVTTAADSTVKWTSACVDITDTTTYYVDAWSFGASGDDDFSIQVVRYTDNACGVYDTVSIIVAPQDAPEAWTHYGGTTPAWGTTESIKIVVGFYTIATTAWVDAVQMRAAPTPTDAGCYADTDAPAVCTTSVQSIHQPLAKNGTWTFEATVRSPVDGAVSSPVRFVFYVLGTAGDNNKLYMIWNSDVLSCYIHDAAGVAKVSTVAAAGNADTAYDVKMYHTSTGRLGCCWDGTCDATESTGALTDGINGTLYFAGSNSTPGDNWVLNPRWYKGLR